MNFSPTSPRKKESACFAHFPVLLRGPRHNLYAKSPSSNLPPNARLAPISQSAHEIPGWKPLAFTSRPRKTHKTTERETPGSHPMTRNTSCGGKYDQELFQRRPARQARIVPQSAVRRVGRIACPPPGSHTRRANSLTTDQAKRRPPPKTWMAAVPNRCPPPWNAARNNAHHRESPQLPNGTSPAKTNIGPTALCPTKPPDPGGVGGLWFAA